jgi:hypothetical protein
MASCLLTKESFSESGGAQELALRNRTDNRYASRPFPESCRSADANRQVRGMVCLAATFIAGHCPCPDSLSKRNLTEKTPKMEN